jgi:hypothetical protein
MPLPEIRSNAGETRASAPMAWAAAKILPCWDDQKARDACTAQKFPKKHLKEGLCGLSRDQGRSHHIIASEGPQGFSNRQWSLQAESPQAGAFSFWP